MGSVNAREMPRHESPASPNSLETVSANVVKIHVDGLGRTKKDLVTANVKPIFKVKQFVDLLVESELVRSRLQELGCFKDVEIHIDTCEGGGRNDYEVTFKVQEVGRVGGSVNTMVGNQEGSVELGLKFPNLIGRGERFQVDYTQGTKRTSQFSASLSKPLHSLASNGLPSPTLKPTLFQQMAEFPSSGFKEINRGLLVDLAFLSAPQVAHNVQYECAWRHLTCTAKAGAFAVREECGHSLKSSLRHILTFDRRASTVFPSKGSLFKLTQEFAGLGGNTGYFKNELDAQVSLPIAPGLVGQACFSAGHMMNPFASGSPKSLTIADRFFLGGPSSIRGFEIRGIGPASDGHSLGGLVYWAAGLHAFSRLPFTGSRGPGLADLFRGHAFVNAGNLVSNVSKEDMMQNYRLTCGLGLALSLGEMARIELNYCLPLRIGPGDKPVPGMQFGVGVHFL